jgi:hypothetical protein
MKRINNLNFLFRHVLFIATICWYNNIIHAQNNYTIEETEPNLFLVNEYDSDGKLICNSYSPYGNIIVDNFAEQTPSSDPLLGNDIFNKNIFLPRNDKGGLPFDQCYNPINHKLYVYCGQKVLIYNSMTGGLITSIKVTDFGDDMAGMVDYLPGENQYRLENRLIYHSSSNSIYCATDGHEIVRINGATDQTIGNPIPSYSIKKLRGISIFFNPINNMIYWVINNYSYMGNLILGLNCTTNTVVVTEQFSNQERILDMQFNGTEIYVATTIALYKYDWELNNSEEVLHEAVGKIEINFTTNKLFALSNGYNYFRIIDLETNISLQPITYSIEIPFNSIFYMNKIYVIGDNLCSIINASNGTIEDEILINFPRGLVLNPIDNVICVAGKNIMMYISADNNSILSVGNLFGGWSYDLIYNPDHSQIISSNKTIGTLTFHNLNNAQSVSYEQVGGTLNSGCYNDSKKRYYFIQYGFEHPNSYLSIVNTLDNSINNVIIGGVLHACNYNPINHDVYITRNQAEEGFFRILHEGGGTQEIPLNCKVWSGKIDVDDEIVVTTGLIGSFPYGTFKIITVDPATFEINSTNVIGPIQCHTIDKVNNKIYVATKLFIYVFDYDLNLLLNYSLTEQSALSIAFNDEFIYVSTASQINKINVDNMTNDPIPIGWAYKLFYHKGYDKLYALTNLSLYSITDEQIKEINYNRCAKYLIYNPINDRIYAYSTGYTTEVYSSYLTSFDCCSDEVISDIWLGQNNMQKNSLTVWPLDHDLTLDPVRNETVTPNLGYSNLSLVKCFTDILGLNYGYRWLSFPRMYRVGNDPYSSENVLMNLNVYPAKAFTLYPALATTPFKQWVTPPPPNQPYWNGILNEVYSTNGYKLYIGQSSGMQPKITLYGARLHPDTELNIAGEGAKQDLGYFIEEAQYPWDAFPSDLYNNYLTSIQAQKWTMVKDEYAEGWIITGSVTPIRYGDMVIVKTNQQGSIGFEWNDPDESEEEVILPEPQYYSYTDQADYTPFFVETDAESDIAEIAVMVDGVCMGANVRMPEDTLVEVNGYFDELPDGSVVEFETWNGLKSKPVKKDGYIVRNNKTGKQEKRNVYIGEKQDYYMISLKAGEVFEVPDAVSLISCQPNPFNSSTTITMQLNCEQRVWVEMYDIRGLKVKTLLNGDLPGGYYEVIWNGDNDSGTKVKEGIYFYKIRTGSGTELTDKIVLID